MAAGAPQPNRTCRKRRSVRIVAEILIAALAAGCFYSRFPPGTLDRFADEWYSAELLAAGEPQLRPTGSADLERYRFTFMAFKEPTTTVRIIREGPQYTLIASRLIGAGSYAPGRLEKRTRQTLTDSQVAHLRLWFEEMKFWEMPQDEPVKHPEDDPEAIIVMADGAVWLLEGADKSRYHLVERQFIEDYPAFERAGICLLVWSGLDSSVDELPGYSANLEVTRRCD